MGDTASSHKKTKIMLVSDKNMLYLWCQTVSPMPSVGSGNDRKFAFVMCGVCESTPRLVNRTDNPKAEAFFYSQKMVNKSDSCGSAERIATQTIHTIYEEEAV